VSSARGAGKNVASGRRRRATPQESTGAARLGWAAAAALTLAAFALNWSWEAVQCRPFFMHAVPCAGGLTMAPAALGDVALAWIGYAIVACASGRWHWVAARWTGRQWTAIALSALEAWARREAPGHPGLPRLGYFGSYARGDWGVGSDLIAIVEKSDEPFERRAVAWSLLDLPVPAQILVYTREEWARLRREGGRFARTIDDEAVWLILTAAESPTKRSTNRSRADSFVTSHY
jgi:hypothetical protein